MRRYVERTQKSKQYTEQHRGHLADPRVVNGFRPMTKEITYQILIERSKGSRLWDIDGNEYVDVLNGFGMNLFGWQPPFVQEAVRKQVSDLFARINKDPEHRKQMTDAGFEQIDITYDQVPEFLKRRAENSLPLARKLGMIK